MRQDQARRTLGSQNLERMGLEREDQRLAAFGFGLLDDTPQKGLMTQVNAVEISQGQNGFRNREPSMLDMTKNFHNAAWSRLPASASPPPHEWIEKRGWKKR